MVVKSESAKGAKGAIQTMSKQKQDKQDGSWQFPKALEIVKCKEGNKDFMKEAGGGE